MFERFSDSAGAYIVLDSSSPQVYKTLFRAAKAKLKLRLRATVSSNVIDEKEDVAKATGEQPQTAELTTPFTPIPVTNFIVSSSSDHHESAGKMRPANLQEVKEESPAPAPEIPAKVEVDAHIPQPFADRESTSAEIFLRILIALLTFNEDFIAELANLTRQRNLALRTKRDSPAALPPMTSWSVFCNECDKPMRNEHFHCSICDDGDYDLCTSCVGEGRHCPGEGHWLLKRFVEDGKVINSTTERIAPKTRQNSAKDMPGAFTEEKKYDEPELAVEEDDEQPTRTCNCCVKGLAPQLSPQFRSNSMASLPRESIRYLCRL